ncbi:hypothetical protein [Spirosoma sp. KUDC1026]|uniref:hypothetical protein n=1 Tax=Spirosoma sp. KUDC1026 TaxID=2745947 RepID=UPI00159BEA39|nr:hypothetical protein [Spirosoma sp. KUDC1026]QKZ13051.1 hypothetical protein HU175_10560 [Spirosoma sp. KUDC1026]
MKMLLLLLLLTSVAYGQVPTQRIRRDSTPSLPQATIPTLRPQNDFYRNPKDPKNVARATLDNMPVMGVDPSIHHTMLQETPPRSKQSQPIIPKLPIPPALGTSTPSIPKKR